MRRYWRIALVSFLILFLELLVIRLVGTEIRIFAYLGNVLLLVIFVGAGLGMILKKPTPLSLSAICFFLLAATVSTSYILRTPRFDVKLFSGISELLSPLSEAYIWQQLTTYSKTGALFGLFLTTVVLALIGLAFVPLGNLLGRLFSRTKKPLTAYSVNVAASLAGMWAFQLFSVLELPPLLGLVIATAALIALSEKQGERMFIAGSVMAMIALTIPKVAYQPYEGRVTFWSPYQKLSLSLIQQTKPHQAQGYYLEVNNTGYMGLLNLGADHFATASAMLVQEKFASPETVKFLDHYSLPYQFKPLPQKVLIIGAGAGNDATAAVRAGAGHVDAVEIDPTIIRIGRQYHPEFPYQDPIVKITNDDGRAFMERSPENRYDLVVMGLADSHTLSSALTNLRLDHYLYTKQSLTRARELLKPDGVLVLSFEVTRPWIGARLQQTITQAFGSDPEVFEVRSDGAFGWGGYVFAIGKHAETLRQIFSNQPKLRQFVSENQRAFPHEITPLTDDWPYLYLDHPRLPLLYLVISALLLLLFWWGKTTVFPSRLNLPMFFWGAAFLLFEFQNISKASLLFGLTWQTNLIIITAAILLILIANNVVRKRLVSAKTGFLLLLLSLVLQLAIPLNRFNQFGFLPKLLVGGTILNLPFLFGAIVFAHWFNKSKDRPGALASNLLGAAIGGILEMFSFLLGIRSLLLCTIVLYLLGWYTRRQLPHYHY